MLEVTDLRVDVGRERHRIHAVRGVTFSVAKGRRLGILGESGSGKSLTVASVLGLLPGTATVKAGSVKFEGRELLGLPERELRRLRGRDVGMVFQNTSSALNPLFKVGTQIADAYRFHHPVSRREARQRAIAILEAMGVPDARTRAAQYPHQFSGGMAQRVMLGMALVSSPRLLIADEPTSGLDLTIQVQVVGLIDRLVREGGQTLVLITHDITVVQALCTDVVVMYAGEVYEAGSAAQVLGAPANPYTRLLLDSVELGADGRDAYIPGVAPTLRSEPPGCAFVDRCPFAVDRCRAERPRLRQLPDGRRVTCHLADQLLERAS